MSYPVCGQKVMLNNTPDYEYKDFRFIPKEGMTGVVMPGSNKNLCKVLFKHGFEQETQMWINPADLDVINGWDHLIIRERLNG